MIVLGIDPGLHRSGFCFAEFQGEKLIRIIESGMIVTEASELLHVRLSTISSDMGSLIALNPLPQLTVWEKPFNIKNSPNSSLVLYGVGAMLSALGRHPIPRVEHINPSQMKLQITGDGRASKNEVRDAIRGMGDFVRNEAIDDEVDAIGIAVAGVVLFGG